jgi:hypothetical protein
MMLILRVSAMAWLATSSHVARVRQRTLGMVSSGFVKGLVITVVEVWPKGKPDPVFE